jgi:hypothetical protein
LVVPPESHPGLYRGRRQRWSQGYVRSARALISRSIGYGTLAAAVVVAHFAFILFVMFGGLLMLRWRRAPWVHLPAAAWGAYVELTGRVCPLTPLEHWLRRSAGSGDYVGDFIDHYLVRVIYPPGLTPEIQLALGAGAVLLNCAIYAWVVRRLRLGPPARG